MRASREAAPTERRKVGGLTFDPPTGRLALGPHEVLLPPVPVNPLVLGAYVTLVAACRGSVHAIVRDVRQNDIDALAAALDLGSEALADQIHEVLGASRDDAERLVARLQESRRGGLARAAGGAALAGSLIAGAGALGAGSLAATGGDAAGRPERPAAVTAEAPSTLQRTVGVARDATASPDQPVTETANGVGLIDPMDADASGVGLVPAAVVDREPTTP